MSFTEEEAKNEHTDHYSISVLLSIVHLALVLQQQRERRNQVGENGLMDIYCRGKQVVFRNERTLRYGLSSTCLLFKSSINGIFMCLGHVA